MQTYDIHGRIKIEEWAVLLPGWDEFERTLDFMLAQLRADVIHERKRVIGVVKGYY